MTSHLTPASALTHASSHARRVGRAAQRASQSRSIEYLARFGFIVRGIIYLVPGVVALELALGIPEARMTQRGAIEMIGRWPEGQLLLIGLAVGLAGYSLWGVIRAVWDPLRRGHSPLGLLQRFGYTTSAFAFGTLFVATLRFIVGAMPSIGADRDWTVPLLATRFGPWVVGIIGLSWIAGAGIGQIAHGWSRAFERDLELRRMGRQERRWAISLGRIGIVARGVVFTTVGMLLVAAAVHANPRHSSGMDGALLELGRQPLGRLLLAAVALGLIVFGVFSVLCSRWMRIGGAGASQEPPLSYSSTL